MEDRYFIIEYLARTELYPFHRKSPWVEIPLSYARRGEHSLIICHSYEVEKLQNVDILETSKLNISRPGIFAEMFSVVEAIAKHGPNIFLQVNVKTPIFIFTFFFKAYHFFIKRRKTIWNLKLDWDGTPDSGSGLNFAIRKLLISINSLLFDRIIVESTCAQEALSGIPMISSKKIRVIPNGYPDDLYPQRMIPEVNRDDMVLCIARFSPVKRQDLLIEAFLKIHEDFPSWKLMVAGHEEDIAYQNSLQNLISANHAEEFIELRANLTEEDITTLYRRAKLFCLPSDKEGFTQVRIEAISNGIPVISSDAGCAKDLFGQEKYTFRPGDLQGLTNLLKTLMTDNERRKKLLEVQDSLIIPYGEFPNLLR